MKRITFIAALIIAATMATVSASAQTNAKTHDLMVSVGAGLSNLNKSSYSGNSSALNPSFGSSFAASFGLGYVYYFAENFGLNTGLELANLKGTSKFAVFSESYQANDGEEDFEYRYTVNNFSERQNALLLNIPLMLRFQQGKFYLAAGGKVGLPINLRYENEAGLQASGYYSHSDVELHGPKFKGFGDFDKITGSGRTSLSAAFFLSAEAGAKWELSGKIMLYTGLYFDYGMVYAYYTGATNHLIEYTGSDSYKPNALVASATSEKNLVNELSPLSFGVKIGISIGSARWWFTKNGE